MTRSRRAWIGTSWKMNKTRGEAVAYLAELCDWCATTELDSRRGDLPAVHRAVRPPRRSWSRACDAPIAISLARPRPSLQLGAQNMHWQANGAQTGEISAEMLLDCGVSIVELGHYERRQHYGETDRSVNLKAAAAIAAGLEAVICVGDSLDDRQYGVARRDGGPPGQDRSPRAGAAGLSARSCSPTSRAGPSEPAASRQSQPMSRRCTR